MAMMCGAPLARGEEDFRPAYEKPPHSYSATAPQDAFTKWFQSLEGGDPKFPAGDEKSFVRSLLEALEVPVSSQMLVYSATSFQRLISPRHARALYFNEETYVGWVPGGRVELASFDAALGPVFYIFNPAAGGGPIRPERAKNCLNCHAGENTHNIPGLTLESGDPAEDGGFLESWRKDETGHGVPFDRRFGGWSVTGKIPPGLAPRANLIWMYQRSGPPKKTENPPGRMYDLGMYLLPTSDVLPQLIHEHQVGFHNRATEAVYRLRAMEDASHGPMTTADEAALDAAAHGLVRYVLFTDEVALPGGGVTGDAQFVQDFQRNKRPGPGGASLRDFDLRTRLFKHRCSYMVYSSQWRTLPPRLKERVTRFLAAALDPAKTSPDAPKLGADEKKVIRGILSATLER